ncbi:MAG: hypothetical protein IJX49_02925 [Clostridia bacterium]|nr:hypothetical protein [Clostridia bacterium]
MLLSSLLQKRIVVGDQCKGVCLGIGFSLKTHAVKYLLCGSAPHARVADFAVGINAVTGVSEVISLSRLRAVHPSGCAKVFYGLPIYAYDGVTLGEVRDMEILQGRVVRLFSDSGASYPTAALFACGDAVILRKPLPFPLGQPLSNEAKESFQDSGHTVTKALLRRAIKKGKLIELTLSLPPFHRA